MKKGKTKIGILGGGPSALFVYKRLIESHLKNIEVNIFERKPDLGYGMPYSKEGAKVEHITNVSDNEIPQLTLSIADWVEKAPSALLSQFNINSKNFNEYKVLPRLFFGKYLSHQFRTLIKKGRELEIPTRVYLNCTIVDVIDQPDLNEVWVKDEDEKLYKFDHLIICSGHNWPKENELKQKGYFDSPYPPSKLDGIHNHPVAIRGSSLTAIDAIRTLAKNHGVFLENKNKEKLYHINPDNLDFKIVMFSRNGFLPAVRFHLEDSHLSADSLLSSEELNLHKHQNDGFIDLDFIFEKNFKDSFKSHNPDFYQEIKDLTIEEFVSKMISLREKLDAFDLLKAEYKEAEKSIKRKESVYWKEALAILSFAMNSPAKYLSAEDMIRLKKVLMPLISVVIAFVPQSSCEVLMALHDAGILEIVAVGDDSEFELGEEEGVLIKYKNEDGESIETQFKTFIDCIGQKHSNIEDFPFKSLVDNKTLSPAFVKFKNKKEGEAFSKADSGKVLVTEAGDYYLKVPGIAINDNFQVLNAYNQINNRVFMMAVPYIGGFNPDYSGLDFCETASEKVVSCLTQCIENQKPTAFRESA